MSHTDCGQPKHTSLCRIIKYGEIFCWNFAGSQQKEFDICGMFDPGDNQIFLDMNQFSPRCTAWHDQSHNKMNLESEQSKRKTLISLTFYVCIACNVPPLPSLQWWNLYRSDVKCISSPLIACPPSLASNINKNGLQQGPVSHDNMDFFFRSWLWNCVFSAPRHGKVSYDPVTKEFTLQNFTLGPSLYFML